MIALLTDDIWLTVPPLPFEYQGHARAAQFHATVTFRQGRRYRLVATRANGQPAFGMYVLDRRASILRANGLLVLTLSGDRICTITRFRTRVLPYFGLPRILRE